MLKSTKLMYWRFWIWDILDLHKLAKFLESECFIFNMYIYLSNLGKGCPWILVFTLYFYVLHRFRFFYFNLVLFKSYFLLLPWTLLLHQTILPCPCPLRFTIFSAIGIAIRITIWITICMTIIAISQCTLWVFIS